MPGRDVAGVRRSAITRIFQYVGGYSNVLKQLFIHPCQPIYARQEGRLTLVKRQETAGDILATYLRPEPVQTMERNFRRRDIARHRHQRGLLRRQVGSAAFQLPAKYNPRSPATSTS